MGEVPADVIAKAVECPETMTYADFMAMDAFLFTSMNMVYREYELSKEGLFSAEEWRQEASDYSRWYLGNEFGKAWWDIEGRGFFSPEFSSYVDDQLALGGGDSYEYWGKYAIVFKKIRSMLSKVNPVISMPNNSRHMETKTATRFQRPALEPLTPASRCERPFEGWLNFRPRHRGNIG